MLTRPLQAADFIALATYQQALAPRAAPVTPEALAEKESQAAAERTTGLVITLREDAIIATVRYSEARSLTDTPGTFWLYFSTLPDDRTAAIFDALYQGALTALAPHQPTLVQGMAREDDPVSVAFFQRHHFQETLRSYGANLDLTTFDPAAHAPDESGLRARGIAIKTYAELADDPQRDRKLYNLQQSYLLEIPNIGHFDAQRFDEWVESTLHSDALLPDAYFVATHGEDYVGVSELFTEDEAGVFTTGSTGVKAAYRRLGIALALKVRALTYAKAQGGVRVSTGMAATNLPMVVLNRRLGFVAEPMWITFQRRLQT
ncbi:MAG: GNAT family N-acetyltransferase [Caldilineaceae bacterium]